MKLLVLGSYFSGNLGDGVICECVAARLRARFPEAEVQICDLLDRHSFSENRAALPSLRQLDRNRYHIILRRFVSRHHLMDKQLLSSTLRLESCLAQAERVCRMDCDLVVFAGGQLLMDSYALILAAYIDRFDARGIPVFLNACGTGPSVSEAVQQRLASALRKPCVRLLSCRDDVALVNALYLDGARAAVETCDPALWSGEVYQVRRQETGSVIGLGVMYPDTERISPRQAAAFWLRLTRRLDQAGLKWRFFVNGGSSDTAFVRFLYRRYFSAKRTLEDCFAPVPETPKELAETVAQFSGIVSFRLHSHIIAASLGIPSVAICWDDKVRFFFRKIGHPERCLTVREPAEQVLLRLQEAVREGVDTELLKAQREAQDEQLYHAILQGTEK